ncbi:MAG: hypothetical protein CO129_03415 [Ignavibacteriales bacterium CG_4_9_14_3_um_filter_34_10]|nr:MAG: hypothetical protein CO129_03415 [Ignavibacteriales bacterium CG_4_9_14_3_um_filter_34_10]
MLQNSFKNYLKLLCTVKNIGASFLLAADRKKTVVREFFVSEKTACFDPRQMGKLISNINSSNYKTELSKELMMTFANDYFTSVSIHEIEQTDDFLFIVVNFWKTQKPKLSDATLAVTIELLAENILFKNDLIRKYEETTSNINSIVYSVSGDGSKYLFISENVKELLGYDSEFIKKNKFSLLRKISPEYFKAYTEFIKKLKGGQKASCEYQITDGKGNKKFIRQFGNPIIIDQKVVRVVGVLNEITDEKQILSRLEKSEEKFRLLVETANDLIILLNSFGYVSLVNKHGAMGLGFSPSEMLGKHFLELIDENGKNDTMNAFQKILSSEQSINFEATLLDKFNHSCLFEFVATPTKDGGVISGMLAIGRDITTRRFQEQQVRELNNKLIEANRIISIERDRAKQKITVLEELNHLKNEFISRVSHELRTPLASIVGFAETIVYDEELPREMINEFSGIILNEGKRLSKVIDDILDFSKLENSENEMKKSDVDFVPLLKNIFNKYEKAAIEKKLIFTSKLPDAEITIYADPDMLSKAIGALIENAIKFTQQNGLVTLLLQDFLKETEVIISDTGAGIAENEIPFLFNKFTKGKVNLPKNIGAGLGLAYVKQVIDLHHGLIQIRSELEKGTSFIIRLPKKK